MLSRLLFLDCGCKGMKFFQITKTSVLFFSKEVRIYVSDWFDSVSLCFQVTLSVLCSSDYPFFMVFSTNSAKAVADFFL